jgi:hypothetical protein
VLLRLTYLAVTNAFAALRLLPMSDRDKDAEILALRHQLVVLQRQLGPARARPGEVGAGVAQFVDEVGDRGICRVAGEGGSAQRSAPAGSFLMTPRSRPSTMTPCR